MPLKARARLGARDRVSSGGRTARMPHVAKEIAGRAMEWQLRAACRDSDPEDFYPLGAMTDANREALATCGQCPVIAECWADCLITRDEFGIRAGLTATQRKKQFGTRTGHARGVLAKTRRPA